MHKECCVLLGNHAKEYWSTSLISTNTISLCGNNGKCEYPQCFTLRTNASSALTLNIKSYVVNQNIYCREYQRNILNKIPQAKLLKMISLCSRYKLPDFAAILHVETIPTVISLDFGTATTKTLGRFQKDRFTYCTPLRSENKSRIQIKTNRFERVLQL